jgi:hypothetical protein
MCILNLQNLTCKFLGFGSLLLLTYFSLSIISCSSKHKDPIPDVSKITVELKLIRFDKEVFQIDTNKLEKDLSILINKYPSFSKLYFEHILSITTHVDSMDPNFVNQLKQFISDSAAAQLYKLVQHAFPENDYLNNELTKSLQFMKYYFPEEKEPVFYTLISEFSYGNFIFQESKERDGLGIGLDFFLGSAFDYKKIDPDNPAFSTYLNRSFNKDHLLKKTWEVWIEDRLASPENGRLLDYMIQNGKKLYTLTKILPELQDTVLFEYSSKQLDWCNHNIVEIWAYFLSNNLLYSTELLKVNKYINPSPNSPGMPPDAPGQTGNFIGYEIVKAYMKRNPQCSLKELWKKTDSQAILNDSRFKPRND